MDLDRLRETITNVEAAVAGGPVTALVKPEEIREYLASRYSFKQPASLEDLLADVEQMMRTWQVQVTHPRYFGLFNPSVTVASVLADTLVAMYNPQLAAWRTSPAANEIERHTLSWLAGKFGFPKEAIGHFTTGGAEANLTAVVVALTRAFPNYGEHGLRGIPATPTIYVSGEAHHSFNKIAHITGLGRLSIRQIRVDADLKMDLEHLASRVAEDRQDGFAPLMVVGTAGTTAAGAIDPLPQLANFCRSQELWLHIDAAWGGAAILSPKLRGHLSGIESADSITCDAHKWFSVPMGAGMFFCRHADVVTEAFRAETSYMPKTTGATLDPYTSSVQWSRRFIGLKLFLSLAHEGESGYAAMIEHQARMGDLFRQAVRRSGWRVVNNSPLPVICFSRDGLITSKWLAELYERQIAWMSEVRLGDGDPVLRACITSFRTTEADVNSVVEQMSGLQS